MLSFFRKPYPYSAFSLKALLTYFWIGCFIFLFLWIFQPFEINIWQTDHKTWKLLGFGFVSFLCPSILKALDALILQRSRPEETWQVWKEIIATLCTLFFIAFGILVYATCIRLTNMTVYALGMAFVSTVLLGIFPVTASVALKYNRFLVLNQKEAEIMEHEVHDLQKKTTDVTPEPPVTKEENNTPEEPSPITDLLILVAENDKDRISLPAAHVLYIESADNYSTIVSVQAQQVKKQMIRSSLKRIESQLEQYPYLLRCHRSYVINLLQIDRIEGNAQGYRITMKHPMPETIPVSRSYSKALFDRLASLK